MLDDKELDRATAAVSEFCAASEQHHDSLTQLVHQYTILLEDYRRLRSDFEEERESRERYKQLARGQERNPFVLVLIDGDGYVFDDDLVSNGAEGGQRAASLLNAMVKNSLRNRGLEHCRVMVRVYANLAGLSRALSKHKLAGPEKRSLGSFAASFTRSNDLFDFVDAGELKENADFKIRAMFRQFVENVQCRHIYFAGCHDVGYLSELTPYTGSRDRITLVRTPSFHHEFSKLGFRVEEFSNIFRASPLDGQSAVFNIKPFMAKQEEPAVPLSAGADSVALPCPFFQRGYCKYGKSCRNVHSKASNNGSSLAAIRAWRQNNSTTKTYPMSRLNKSDHDFMLNGNKYDAVDPTRPDFTALPEEDDIPVNAIAVNKMNHRLDAFLNPPTYEDRARFNSRIALQKLCNNHQIRGSCPKGDRCEYDHDAISSGIVNCLKQVAATSPCPRKGFCRLAGCIYGHICQIIDCNKRGGKFYCKFGMEAHQQPLEVVKYITAMGIKEEYEAAESIRNPASPVLTTVIAVRTLPDSDDDEEQGRRGQGALLDFEEDDGVSPD